MQFVVALVSAKTDVGYLHIEMIYMSYYHTLSVLAGSVLFFYGGSIYGYNYISCKII